MSIETAKKVLSKGEQAVHDYIREKTALGKHPLKESMKTIGLNLGLSEATVHRAVSKLVSGGVIGITSPTDKSESNTITFYGEPESIEDLKTDRFFDMILEVQQRSERFKNIIEAYQVDLENSRKENDQLKNTIEEISSGKLVESYNEALKEAERSKQSAAEAQKKIKELKAELKKIKDSTPAPTPSPEERFIVYGDHTIKETDIIGTTDINEELIAFITKKNN